MINKTYIGKKLAGNYPRSIFTVIRKHMDTGFDQIKAEINKLVSTCYGRSYKNRDSLNDLKLAFERLGNARKGIILRYHNFPGDLSVAAIIEDIEKLLAVSRDKKLLEWSFDHYNDLFKFRAEDLLADISKMVVQRETHS